MKKPKKHLKLKRFDRDDQTDHLLRKIGRLTVRTHVALMLSNNGVHQIKKHRTGDVWEGMQVLHVDQYQPLVSALRRVAGLRDWSEEPQCGKITFRHGKAHAKYSAHFWRVDGAEHVLLIAC